MRPRRVLQNTESSTVLRSLFRVSPLLLVIAMLWVAFAEKAQALEVVEVTPAPLGTEPASDDRLNAAQLQLLVGPIALYSDDLLALVLGAAAHPLQAINAARRLKERRNSGEPINYNPNWHPSVVALTHYPQVLERFDRDLEWTQMLHQAVQEQNDEVLAAVQSFRRLASQAQNLSNTDQVIVQEDEDFIRIRQRDPKVIYVPDYQPKDVVVMRRSSAPKVVYQTRRSPIIYRSYNRFDPYYASHFYNDPFWHDPFWSDPLWGINGGLFLSWRDNHYYPRRAPRYRAKSWKNRGYKRHHNSYRHSRYRPHHKTNWQNKRVAKTDARNQRPSRRHHAADAFNQPMLGNRQVISPSRQAQINPAKKPKTSVTPSRSQRPDNRTKNNRRYTPEKRAVMNKDRRPGRHEHIK